MEIVGEHTHRVLAYVDALNRHGIKPQPHYVEEFAKNPEQLTETVGGMAAFRTTGQLAATWGGRRVPRETFPDYMSRVGWLKVSDDQAEVTAIGRALLKALNAPVVGDAASDVIEVVLDPDNPFAYAQAMSGIASVNQALLVEPYFRLEQLVDVTEFDNVVRVLVGSKLKAKEYELLATGLASVPAGREIEVRKAQDLHDRYLIPAVEGKALMLGISLGGIGRKVSTLTTLGELATQALRAAYEAVWDNAEKIEPKVRAVAAAEPTTSATGGV